MNETANKPAPGATEERWLKVISPRQSIFHLPLRELWLYRDLIKEFTWRDLTAAYKQTILGPVWILLQPLLTTIVFTIVFGRIANISTDGIPKFLFYLSGNVLWSYFSNCLTKTSDVFRSNAAIFGKVYFPRLVLPISSSITNLVHFGVQFLFFLGFFVYFLLRGSPLDPSYRIICLPLLVICMAALGLGAGCLASSLTVRYRDLSMLVGFGVQLWMYGSCVVFPLSEISPEWRWVFLCNPMVPIIEAFRFSILGAGVVEVWQLLISMMTSFVVLAVGIFVFNKVEKTFVDSV